MSSNGRHSADEALITALAAGVTRSEAAKAVLVSPKTVQRRMDDPGFRDRVEERRGEMVSAAVGRASAALIDAVETLQDLARSAESEAVRVSAARSLLQFVAQRREPAIREAIRGVRSASSEEITELVKMLLDTALGALPPGSADQFLSDVESRLVAR